MFAAKVTHFVISVTAGGKPFVCAHKVSQRMWRHRVNVGSCSVTWHWGRIKHAFSFNTRRWERRDELRRETTDRTWYGDTSTGARCGTFKWGTTTTTGCSSSPKVLEVEKASKRIWRKRCDFELWKTFWITNCESSLFVTCQLLSITALKKRCAFKCV